jgi:hypothetical protein
LGRTLAARSESLVSAGDLTAARADLSQAAALFEAQGAAPAAMQAREALAALEAGGAH